MGILGRILFPFIKKKFIKEGGSYAEKTINWGIEDWKTYQANRFDELKSNEWTRRAFPKLKDVTYDELPFYDKTLEYPTFPDNFPAYRTIYSTGTIKRKLIKFTKEDMLFIARTIVGELQKATNSIGKVIDRNLLALAGGDAYVSGSVATIVSLAVKRAITFDPIQMKKNISRIKKLGPFNVIAGILAFLFVFLEQLDESIFSDDLWLVTGGDALTPSVQTYLKNKIKELSDVDPYLMDSYGCSEGVMLGLSMEFLERDPSLVIWPSLDIMVLEKENGEMINILDAKKGDRGILYITPMFTFMIPNYKLGDIIEITGFSNKFNLPKIRVLGRQTYKVTIKHPVFGEIEGISGAHLRIFGIPFNTWAFDRFMSKLSGNYTLIVEKEGNKALFKLYADKKISKEFLVKQFENDIDLQPIYHGIINNVIDIEVKPINFTHADLVFSNWKGGQLKVPKIIVKSRVIAQPSQLVH